MKKTLHIELTNRCTLFCPACPRTEWANILKRPVPKMDLDYNLLDSFLDCPGGKEIDQFLLCGDYGDAIYYPKLIEFVKHFRQSKSFLIATNGSRQSKTFWEKLAELLTSKDTIKFGIDGLEDDNDLYRKNSDWKSIMQGMEIIKNNSDAKIIWQTIVFKFNQNKLDVIKDFAHSKGAEFLCLKTHRYGDDSLIPDQSFVQTEFSYKQEYEVNNQIEIDPKCSREDTIPTVGCDGIFYPCDWIRNPNTFYKSLLWKQKDKWIKKLHIGQCNYDEAKVIINDWASNVKWNSCNNGQVDNLCKMKCRKELNHA